jgi:capsular polysaccharide biosynthesis protein
VSKEPVSPNKVIITALATTISMLFAILLIFIANALKAKVNDSQTIEFNSSIPVALLTPKLQTS